MESVSEQSDQPTETTPSAAASHPTRRRLLVWLIRLSAAAFAAAFALPALALRTLTQVSKSLAPGDVLAYATGNQAGQPINANNLQPGQGVQAFPRGKTSNEDNLVELVRLASGQNTGAIVAYSAICTHLGCVVHAQLNAQGLIACPCHGSLYNPADDAAVVRGPAPRPLPSLPIKVDANGDIVAAGEFSGPIGPQ
jgi:rieske iron-sulfur protein